MSDKVIQVMLALPAIHVDELEGVDSINDLIKLFAKNQDAEQWHRKAVELKHTIATFGRDLELILDEVDDQYERAQSLRRLVSAMKDADNERF